ncbi:MAG TPA: hypothetical protein ENJ02_08980, partial [Chloroflexi bacterium]|nr:hypothetical protein [Chloroflexota bacterium]
MRVKERSPLLKRVRRHRRVSVLFRASDDRRPTVDGGRRKTDDRPQTTVNRPSSTIKPPSSPDTGLDEHTWARLQAIHRRHRERDDGRQT